MGDQRTYYVYIIFRLDGSPCYVGKGKGKRLNSHFSRKSHNRYLDRIIKKEGRKLPIVKIRQNLTEYEALHIERSFISAIGKIREGGTLVNFTDGGEGISGFRFSSKSKNKMRVAKLGKTLTAEHKSNISNSLSGIFVGRKHTLAARQKMRESKLSMPFDKRQVYIEKLSKIKTGVSLSDETKLKMSLAQKGKKKSLAHRAAIKASWTLRKKRADLCV